MKRILVVAFLLLPLVQAYAQAPPGASDVEAGKEMWRGYFGFQNDCKLCHGEQGQGGFASALAGHRLTPSSSCAPFAKGERTRCRHLWPTKI